jgi:hypothetical protein
MLTVALSLWQWATNGGAVSGGSGPAAGDGLLLEDGTSFLLLETGDFLLLE